MTFTNFNSYFILAWDSNAHIGEDPWCTRLHICEDILCNMERRFISLKKRKQITAKWRMERRFKVLKKGRQITTEWRMERRFFIFLKNGLPSIWKEDHKNFGEMKVTSALFYKVTSTMHIRHDYKEGEEVAAHRRIYGNFHTKRNWHLGKRRRGFWLYRRSKRMRRGR